MEELKLMEPVPEEVGLPPTEDELPYEDDRPMETNYHLLQLYLLLETLKHFYAGRQVYVGGNMFIYFSLAQVRHQDFRGPDFFVVLDVSPQARKSWVVWQEGKGPDLVIELLSESTAAADKGEKKQVYQDQLRVPEYYWYDPLSGEWAGFVLHDGVYQPLAPDERGRLISQKLGLALVRWEGTYLGEKLRWLRWETLEGVLLPTGEELAAQAQQRAQETQQRAQELEELLARYRARFGDFPE
jgi:Uma2 family endonuclease